MLNIIQPLLSDMQKEIKRSFLDDLNNRERARQDGYIKARQYYDGIHNTQLTDRMREFLHIDVEQDFTANYCPTVVNAKADRLKVTGLKVEDDEQAEILWSWWRKNRMDRKQGIVHLTAGRDGDSFVLVEWDKEANMPRFNYEPAFASEGVMVYYSEERRDEIKFASKHWQIKHGGDAGTTSRLNLYFPDRIEKYISKHDISSGDWMPFNKEDEIDSIEEGHIGMAGVSWWTDTRKEGGNPLGIPIVHFKNNDTGESFGTSDLAKVMPIQDAVNKSLIDVLAASDSEGFGQLIGYGTLKWESMKTGGGAITATTLKKGDANLERLEAGDPSNLMAVYNNMVIEIARITGTPLSYFQQTGHVAAEGTMKQQEISLVSQVEKSQTDFGNSWEDCFIIARRLSNAFSDNNPELDEDQIIDTVWEEAESRNDKVQAETLSIKVDKLGVSKEQAQLEMGYDSVERASFTRANLRETALAIRGRMAIVPVNNDNETAAQNLNQTENEEANETNGTGAT
jgi:hypothetical protein